MSETLSYIAITPVRDEAENLRRLAPCMIEQAVRPTQWIIVDNGSTDETPAVSRELSAAHPWISLLEIPGDTRATRGAPVVRAFHAGLEALAAPADVVVKLDADVSFSDTYFSEQLDAFRADPALGIASGICMEPQPDGTWEAAHVTRDHVRGAVRAYRWQCLQDVTPLEERMGWDGVDELRAQVSGWRTQSLPALSFLHHRVLGARESTWFKWLRQGEMAHFMDYRVSYLLARTLFNLRHQPSAIAMPWGYMMATLRREPRCVHHAALERLRHQQSLRVLPARVAEKLGAERRPAASSIQSAAGR